jgi:hypothetical protein
MVNISDLNKKEREIRKSLADIEKKFKNNNISKVDYSKIKKGKEGELKSIELERKTVIARLPTIPPPPSPSKKSPFRTSTPASGGTSLELELKKHEKDLLFTQSEMSKMFAEVVKNRERVKNVETMAKNISSRPQETKIDVKTIDDRIKNQFQGINSTVTENSRKSREDIERMSDDVSNMKRDISELKEMSNKMKGMDVSGLKREIESLKERNRWLEQQINNLDIEPLYELIKEIENKVSSNRIGVSPVIIE